MNFWKDKKVLITGGAGFIGSNLAERMVALGAKVLIVDNLERGSLDYIRPFLGNLEFRQQDLRNRDVCQDVCRGIEIVFHLASKVGSMSYYLTRPAEVLSQTLLMDGNVLQAAKECGVSRYFYASSSHVYPLELELTPDAPPLREEQAFPASPALSYGWAKIIAEKQIEYAIAEGCDTNFAIGRIMGAYGKNQDISLDKGSSIPVFSRRAIEWSESNPFTILGTGKETRSYCYVGDVLDAMLLCVEKLEQNKFIGPVNIGSDQKISIGNLAEEIIRISGKSITPIYNPSHKTQVWGQSVDAYLAKKILDGWYPKTTLQEGLGHAYRYVQEKLK